MEERPISLVSQAPRAAFKVPSSAFGAAAILPALITPDDYPNERSRYYFILGSSALQVLASVFTKAVMCFYARVIVDDQVDAIESGSCVILAVLLVVTSQTLFIVTIFRDIENTLMMAHSFLFHIPTIKGTSHLRFGTRAPKVVKTAFAEEKPPEPAGEVEFIGGGLTVLYKALVLALVTAPELFVTLALLYEGTSFLAASASNLDVMLNTLALEFVMGVDEVFFEFLASGHVLALVDSIPPFVRDLAHLGQWERSFRAVAEPIKVLAVAVCVAYCWYFELWCGHVGDFYTYKTAANKHTNTTIGASYGSSPVQG